MGKLIYGTITSLDGYVADEDGNFDWAAPDEEVHTFVNDLQRPIGTYLYGRRMYEVMVYWETAHAHTDQPSFMQDFAQFWQAADKIVYSKTLETVSSARTRIERDFDPDAVRRMKAQAERDISVGGPELAAQAFKAGLVDECHLFVTPTVVGGGKRFLPNDVRLELELLDERRFGRRRGSPPLQHQNLRDPRGHTDQLEPRTAYATRPGVLRDTAFHSPSGGSNAARGLIGERLSRVSWSIPDISSSSYARSVVVRTLPKEAISRRWALRASSSGASKTVTMS